jgi:hypothetical protein
MQSELIQSRALFVLNIIALLVIFALGFKEFAQPPIVRAIYRKQYEELMFKCDNVMREHLIAKNRMLNEASGDSVKVLNSAEVGLIECHDYDVMRKRLISLGLTDNDLSLMGLEALEERGADVETFVKIHEFKY